MIRFTMFAVLVILNLAHPFLHAFEGGGLDVMLVHLDALALQIDPYLPGVKR